MKFFLRKNIVKSMLIKEFKQLSRDRKMLFVLFIVPIVMLIIFGYAANTDVNKISMAILDEDKTSGSRSFIEKFSSSGYFIPYIYLDSEKELNSHLDKANVDMFIHISREFSKKIKSGKSTEVQLLLDGTDSSRASVIMAYVTQITNTFSFDYLKSKIKTVILARNAGGMRMKEIINLKERVLFNPDLASRNFFLPGVLGLLTSLITIMLTAMSVVKERESGTIDQIIVSPIRPGEYIAGKTLPFAIVAFIDIILITIVAITWFRVPFNGSFIFLMFSGIFYILSTLAVGLYISTVSKTQQQAMLSTFLFFIPAILFSGFIFPIYAMPESIQLITWLNPLRYFITIIRGIFLKGVGISILWSDTLALFIMGAALLTLSAQRFKRRME